MRRGRATANSAFGNAASVLVGDFIYTRAFQLVAQLQSLDILRIMADATNVLAEGEVQQLMNVNDPDTTEESYMQVPKNQLKPHFKNMVAILVPHSN